MKKKITWLFDNFFKRFICDVNQDGKYYIIAFGKAYVAVAPSGSSTITY